MDVGRVAIYFKVALGTVLLAVVLVFTAQNAETVRVRFLSWDTELSRALLIFFVLLIGLLVGALLPSLFRWRSRRR